MNVFRYVDYDDPYNFENEYVEREKAREIIALENNENGFADGAPENAIKLDSTYVNVDFHAEFVAYDFQGGVVCDGVPARIYWTLYKDYEHAYVRNVRFAAPEISDDIAADHFELYKNAQTVFCTAAVLRALEPQLDLILP